MPDDSALWRLFDDLEQQAEGLHLDERAAEVAALQVAEYADLDLASRLLGSTGFELVLRFEGGLVLRGRLVRAAVTWSLIEDDHARTWVVVHDALVSVAGLGDRSVPESSRTVLARLGLGSALRSLADSGSDCLLHLRDGSRVEGSLLRVGHDFVEVLSSDQRTAVRTAVIAAVQDRG